MKTYEIKATHLSGEERWIQVEAHCAVCALDSANDTLDWQTGSTVGWSLELIGETVPGDDR